MKCILLEIGWMLTKGGDKGGSSECLMEQCAWWEDYWDKCCIAVDAYLKGTADYRHDVQQEKLDRLLKGE